VAGIFATLISGAVLLPGLIFWVIGGITGWFMDIVLSIPIIPGSAAGAPPIFVEHGWNLMRGLANMFFLLTLVFIGLATILRLREYELQRTLPRLIIAALLVNFSAVLVGFIVDISNLLASYFLDAAKLNLNLFADIWNGAFAFQQSLANNSGLDIIDMVVGAGVYVFAMWVFYLTAALAYLAILVIFFLRTLVLWVLVIFSPLAFASAVLPATRGLIWNRWWSALLQWSFVIVPISFFLFLSNSIMLLDSKSLFSASSPEPEILGSDATGVQAALAQFLGNAMGPFVGVIVLLLGITVSMSLAPGSIRAVGTFTRRAAIVTTGILGAKALLKAAENKGLRGRVQGWTASANPRWGFDEKGEKQGGIFAGAKRGVGGVTGFGKRLTGKPVENLFANTVKKKEQEANRRAMQQNDAQNRSDMLQAGSNAEKRGVWQAVLQRRRTRQFFDTDTMTGTKEEREWKRAQLENAALGAYRNAIDEGDDDTMEGTQRVLWHEEKLVDRMAAMEDQLTANNADTYNDKTGYKDPETGDSLPGITESEYDQGIRSFREKIFRGARTQDEFRQFQRRAIRKDEFIDLMHSQHGSSQQAAAFVGAFGQEGVQRLEARKQNATHYAAQVQKRVKTDAEGQAILVNGEKQPVMEHRNLSLARWEAATGGQNTGISAKEGAETVEQVRQLNRVAKDFSEVLTNITDKATRDQVQAEFEAILDEMQDLGAKRDVMSVLKQDPSLRDIFQAIPKENEQARRDVAQALNQIQDTSQWRDIGDILKSNPDLSHVAPQLAGISDPAQRKDVADMLGKVQNRGTRSEAANVLQQTPDLVNTANEIHVLASLSQQLSGYYRAELKRVEDVQKLKSQRGENTSVEDAEINTKQAAIKKAEKDLNTLNGQHDQAYKALQNVPNAATIIPQAERLEDILRKPSYYDEGDDGGASQAGGGRRGGPRGGGGGPRRGGGGPRRGGGGGRRGRGGRGGGTPPPVAGGSDAPTPFYSDAAPKPDESGPDDSSPPPPPRPTPPPRPAPTPAPSSGSERVAEASPLPPPKVVERAKEVAGDAAAKPKPPPDWLKKGFEKVETGNIPTLITKRLEKYLKDGGVTEQEFNRMKPEVAWQRAKDISGSSPGPRGPAPQASAAAPQDWDFPTQLRLHLRPGEKFRDVTTKLLTEASEHMNFVRSIDKIWSLLEYICCF